jgi:carbon-monoxide dehydrogenase medium subunit
MKPARFAYRRAGSIDAALTWLADGQTESKILAGGQSLVPLLNMRLARPTVLVDVNRIPELHTIAVDNEGLTLGATVRYSDLLVSALVAQRAPLLVEAVRHIGHRAIRHLGTLGGSLAHADPAAELPATLVALGGTVVVAGPYRGSRTIAAEDLCIGPFVTSLQPTELLCEIRVPDQRGSAWGFAEMARRPGDFAIAGVVTTVRLSADVCQSVRLVAFGVGDGPVRLDGAERTLLGNCIDSESARRAGELAVEDVSPPTDVHASAAYRQHLISVLTEQVLLEARARVD